MKNILGLFVLFNLVVGFSACTSQRDVKRISTDQTVDLSGRWNDSDSRLTAEALIEQILGERWLTDFMQAKSGNRPAVVVGLVKNDSHEHINTETFIKDLERSFIKSGKIRLIQAGENREALRAERADQQQFASQETVKKWGKEIGADFILQGSINSIVDSYKKEKIVYYQVNLELTNLETNEVVWIGEKKIKKYVND